MTLPMVVDVPEQGDATQMVVEEVQAGASLAGGAEIVAEATTSDASTSASMANGQKDTARPDIMASPKTIITSEAQMVTENSVKSNARSTTAAKNNHEDSADPNQPDTSSSSGGGKKKKKNKNKKKGAAGGALGAPPPGAMGIENGDQHGGEVCESELRAAVATNKENARRAAGDGGAASLRAPLGGVVSGSGASGTRGNEHPAIRPAVGVSVGADKLNGEEAIRRLYERRRAKAAGMNASTTEHKFWDTQPMMKRSGEDNGEAPGEIESKRVEDVRQEPYNMAPGFEWCHVDVKNEGEAEEVYTLLSENYVEDDDNMFRFDYSKEFLRWALTPPGYSAELHVGVRSSKGKLMGLITAVPTQMRIMNSSIKTVEINFLCVHKKLRAKRLAPVLIKEVTRRVNLMGIWQAVYTAGVVLPTPLACCRYYHRSLNPKKLIEVGFSRLANRMTMARTLKLYKLPDSTNCSSIAAMVPEDVPSAHALLTSYLEKFKLAPQLTEEEFAHWLLPREGVVDCFVVKDKTGKVTDMCSFYHLPSTVIGHERHRTLNAAYSFYNVATTVSMTDLIRDSLILARNLGMDVFNALNLMQNQEFLQTLKFGIGDGHLQYYLYNWRCKEITPEEVGLVLL